MLCCGASAIVASPPVADSEATLVGKGVGLCVCAIADPDPTISPSKANAVPIPYGKSRLEFERCSLPRGKVDTFHPFAVSAPPRGHVFLRGIRGARIRRHPETTSLRT